MILGDMQDKLKEIPNSSIDAIFTDPPYEEEFLYLAKPLGLESWRILRPGSSLFIIAPNPGKSYEYYFDTIRSYGFKFQQYIPIVHGGNIDMLHDNLILVYQKPLLWFYKPDKNGRMTIYKAVRNIIYSDPPDKDEKEEFAWLQSTKEVKQMLEAVTVPGMKVLDPMTGEGTTGEGAEELGLYFTGIEINKRHTTKQFLGYLN